MITITNPKVAGFAPVWANFSGFTLLFDNPGPSETVRDHFAFVDCQIDAAQSLSLYRGLWQGLQEIGVEDLTHNFLFCPLPPTSYHVTVWDGVNQANLQEVKKEWQAPWRDFLSNLPHAVSDSPLLKQVYQSMLVTKPNWDIEFRVRSIEKWGPVSIVACLEPAAQKTAEPYVALKRARLSLSSTFHALYEVRPGETYVPHITLGYFANETHSKKSEPFLKDWSKRILNRVENLTIEFKRVSVYGFENMALFFKKR